MSELYRESGLRLKPLLKQGRFELRLCDGLQWIARA
jgi:hypothetical protein